MTSDAPNTMRADYLTDWRPPPAQAVDGIAAHRARELAATLDLPHEFAKGTSLPLLWHWIYFHDWPKTADLGIDGHPLTGPYLPPIPHRRRMFAGGRINLMSPLVVGVSAMRHSAIAHTVIKRGRTGDLLFVTLRHRYIQSDQVCLIEEQDLVYRSDESSSTPFTRVMEPLALPPATWTAQPRTHPALLFRFSALTANAHRIHYDEAYATQTEGFPGLVVHGPLLAMYMAGLMTSHVSIDGAVAFEFRLSKPVFVEDLFQVQSDPTDDGATATVVSGAETVHASATIRLR